MNTSFEQSKSFELTNDEKEYLNQFLVMYLALYNSVKESTVTYVLNREIAEKLCKEVGELIPNIKNNNWGRFLSRSISEGCSGIKINKFVIPGKDPTQRMDWTYEKILPDRSVFKFSYENLKTSLYDLGRFYLARQLDHRYDGLTTLNSYWKELDDYVTQREDILKMDRLKTKLPELEGVF